VVKVFRLFVSLDFEFWNFEFCEFGFFRFAAIGLPVPPGLGRNSPPEMVVFKDNLVLR
jgi:hypothetical protein